MADPFRCEVARTIWSTRYRAAGEAGVDDTWRRVARALASVEARDNARWEERFHALLRDFRFLPGGRILAGAGVAKDVTLLNCFVMGAIADDLAGIFEALKEGAVTLQQGGGVGYDFSTLRPAGYRGGPLGAVAPGPVAFMAIWDKMCATIMSTGARRGAMMATLRCDHPDIADFVDAKRDARALRNFNLSVLISDAFMRAVAGDRAWPLVFPAAQLAAEDLQRFSGRVQRRWSGRETSVPCAVCGEIQARDLWSRIMRANYDTAEPGVLFIDRINAENNLAYREAISATNPCGEIPLPNYGACDLGSLNLTSFVRNPFSEQARLDLDALVEAAQLATRLLDDVLDASRYPLAVQADQARGSRRIGLGITGLADALIMLGLRYDSRQARQLAATAMQSICHAAYRASAELAAEKGAFPFFDRAAYLRTAFVQRLPAEIRSAITACGIRNSHLLAIAPAGTISLLANNISSGLEPVFKFDLRRRVRVRHGEENWFTVEDCAARLWRERAGNEARPLSFVDAQSLRPEDHLAMQAAVQPYVDNAISKTINVPGEIAYDDFASLYRRAFELGLKGCTTYRPNPVTGTVLADSAMTLLPEDVSHCCGLDQGGD